MSSSIHSVQIKNFGKITDFTCNQFSSINLVIGENGTGKSFLLKAMYSALRCMESYRRGEDIRTISDIIGDKLRWTFQVDKLGDIVTKSQNDPLSLFMDIKNDSRYTDSISYQFGDSTTSRITTATPPKYARETNSIFIPAKEVLSLYSIILKSREIDKLFGFDDTYYDLAKAIRVSPSQGRDFEPFAKSRKLVSKVIDGRVDLDDTTGKWYYRNNKGYKFSIGATSEGIKKIAIMDRLLTNGYLDTDSIIFIDEIEAALHPQAICEFLDMIDMISTEMKMQVFISSHSYFVIKKLFLIAMKRPGSVTCISLNKNAPAQVCSLSDGMPRNSIIQTSVSLYEEEIRGALQ